MLLEFRSQMVPGTNVDENLLNIYKEVEWCNTCGWRHNRMIILITRAIFTFFCRHIWRPKFFGMFLLWWIYRSKEKMKRTSRRVIIYASMFCAHDKILIHPFSLSLIFLCLSDSVSLEISFVKAIFIHLKHRNTTKIHL